MKIVITGSTGLLGSKLVHQLNEDHQLYPIFNTNPSNHVNSLKLDITNLNKITKKITEIKPDVLIHSAAMTHVDECEQNPNKADKINHKSTVNIIKSAKKTGTHLLFVSTDYVFDGEKGNYIETDIPNPINVYGKTKLDAEIAFQNSDVEYTIVRPSVIYGNKPSSGKINFVLWVINELKIGNGLSIINDQVVSPTYNDNLARMISELIERKLNGLYHLSGSTQIDRYSFTKLIADIYDLDKSLIRSFTSDKMNWIAKRPMNSSLNVGKANTILRNKPEKLEKSLKKLKDEMIG
jgi:dTDP-4-dehydrorhamnose reductase